MGRFSIILIVGFAVIAGGLKLNYNRIANNTQNVSNNRYNYLKIGRAHV